MGANTQTGHVMTLANSIIGVAILAMPFCFQKCGILLSIVLLIIINISTRICCHYLIKSSVLCRRRSMEAMALHVFGPSGKLMVELCTIGYLMGTCVAYFVVVGDIGPRIISKTLDIAQTDTLRVWTMLVVTFVCILPLGLLKNVDSLSSVCTASIGFYFCLVVKVMAESRGQIFAGEWLHEVHFWRWSGVLQCLPIFSLSLSCQIVIFEVLETVSNATLSRMNDIVKSAISMCTCVYMAVGFFGYVAFFKQEFSGNILMNLEPSASSDVIQMGFVLSVACSFPLMIFPCRASLYSLLYKRDHSEVIHYIPEHRFRLITLAIVLPALIIGILTPSIELIIGLVGSTIGVAICILFPAACFIKVGKRDSTELVFAKFVLVFGLLLMVLGTYANLVAFEDSTSGVHSRPGAERLHGNAKIERTVTFHDFGVREVPFKYEPAVRVAPAFDAPLSGDILSANDVKEFVVDRIVEKRKAVIIPVVVDPVIVVPEVIANVDGKLEPEINHEAIAREEHEIAVEAKARNDEQMGEITKTKELVRELAKQNEKVLEKFEEIVGKVEHIEKVQEQAAAQAEKKDSGEKVRIAVETKPQENIAVERINAGDLASGEKAHLPEKAQSPKEETHVKVGKQEVPMLMTDDHIVNMIKKSGKSENKEKNIALKAPVNLQPTLAPDLRPALNDDNVQEIPLHPSHNETLTNTTSSQRLERDLLSVRKEDI